MDLQHGFWIGYLIIRSFFLDLKAVRREILLFFAVRIQAAYMCR